MQLARPAVIVQAVGDVRVLLKLDQRQPWSDRVDRAWRNEEELPRYDWPPVEQFLDRTVEGGSAHLFFTNFAREAEPERRAGLRIDNIPAFGLPARQSPLARLRIIGMNLDRQ